MPKLLPFAGLRPDPALTGPLDNVVCPPYDVISAQQRLSLMARSPFNVVRVELPEGHYEEAARLLAEWTATGALKREQLPALYGYRMTYKAPDGSRRQATGVLGALVLEPPGGDVLPHERTTPKAKTDRLELIRAVKANTSPVWCLCPRPGLANIIEPTYQAASAARDDEGVAHEIWPIFDATVQEHISELIGQGPLLIADGHHRYEVALAYQAEVVAHRPDVAAGSSHAQLGGPDCVLALVVELTERHLQVLAVHRLVSGLPQRFDATAALRASFELRPFTGNVPQLLAEMNRAGSLGVLTAHGAWTATPSPDGPRLPSGGLDLDSSRADTVLGEWPPHELRYEASPDAITTALRSGQADLALLCRPAPIGLIAKTAEGGERMPPKTTYFWPKPLTGMVLRDFSA
ncbi:MAG: DUF1015 family protein [Acidimicrobiales bacterium]